MTDTFSPAERSEIMRRVRGRDTSLELALRRCLWAAGARGYRLHAAHLPGKPDLSFPRWKLAVFIDGCYWHGCPQHCRMPASNIDYWTSKIGRNVARDKRTGAALRRLGWKTIRIWEHEARKTPDRAAARVLKALAALK